MSSPDKQDKHKHLFHIEVLIETTTNGKALEQLTQVLNSASVIADYNITSGIQLGQQIKQAVQEHTNTISNTGDTKQIVEMIQHFMDNETLVRLSIVKGKGVKLSLPCRILHFDPEKEQMTVYHVDEKKVYPIRLNEVDDFQIT